LGTRRTAIRFEIEAMPGDAMAELGTIPKEAAKAIWERGAVEPDRIDEIEKETKHDVIAFLTNAPSMSAGGVVPAPGHDSSDVLDRRWRCS